MTAILPGPIEALADASLPAGAAVLNGAGELTGFLQVREWGLLETPVLLTATMSVGRVLDGARRGDLRGRSRASASTTS